jgi:hypothetical protein
MVAVTMDIEAMKIYDCEAIYFCIAWMQDLFAVLVGWDR